MYTYVFMTSIRVIPVSAVLSRVPYECLYLQKWVTPPLSRAAPLQRDRANARGSVSSSDSHAASHAKFTRAPL